MAKVKADVVFKVFEKEGDDDWAEVVALFPRIDEGYGFCLSYQHMGQHSVASRDLLKELRTATKAESKDLRKELESIGYILREVRA